MGTAMGCVPDLLKNIHRRHDFVADMTSGLSLSYSERGTKFDPASLELLVRDPAVIKHILKDNFDNYSKAENDLFWTILRRWLGQGIFATPHGPAASDGGRNWSRQRKIASMIFSRSNFNSNMNEVFVSKGRHMTELLEDNAAKGRAVDMQGMFFQYTMDSIMQIFFGEQVDTMGGTCSKYASAYDTAHRCLIEYYLKSLPVLSLCKFLPWPFGGIDGIAHMVHRARHPLYAEFKAALQTLDSESRRMIAACRADERLSQRKDMLALFVQAEAQQEESMSTAWLRDVVLNMVIAGRDTTACTLSWMFFILATHPEIQRKLQVEIDTKFDTEAAPTVQSVSASELPYLNGVLYETLRLYPPVPIDGKSANADDVLPDGTNVPAGTKLSFLPYAMGRDPNIYPEPEVVNPERWIPFKEPSPYEFPVFQAGPRICIGMNMAIFEAKIATLMLLSKYRFEMAPGEADKITYLPTALTMSICNTKNGNEPVKKFDSHNLWLIPHLRNTSEVHLGGA